MLLIRVSVIRGETRQDLLSRQSSRSSLQSIVSETEDQDIDFSDSQSDSDHISEIPLSSSGSGLPRYRFRQVSIDETSSAHFSNAELLPHDFESEPVPPSSDFESGSTLSSDFETLPFNDNEDSYSTILDSTDDERANKRQKRTYLTHDHLVTQIGLQQSGNQDSPSRPSRTQVAPKFYARKKISYTKKT